MWKTQLDDSLSSLINNYTDHSTTTHNSGTTTNNTIILLIDNDINVKSTVFKLLKLKFHHQQLGKKLWLENRESKHYEYIPIEFSKDSYFVTNFIKKMNQIGKNKYYQNCPELLSDEVKMKIDVVLNSEIEKLNYSNVDVSLIDRILRICKQSETQCIEIICQIAKIVTDLRKFIREYEDVFPFIDKLLHDEEFLLKCISTKYKVFKFVKYRVSNQAQKGDFILLLKCLNISGKVLKYILDSCTIFNSKEVMMNLLQASTTKFVKNGQEKVFNRAIGGEIYGKLSYWLQRDGDIILLAAEKGFPVLRYILEKNKDDDRFSLYHKSYNLRSDREIVIDALKRDRNALDYAPKDLRNDREFIFEMVTKFNASLHCMKEWKQDEELVLLSIRNHPDTLRWLSRELKNRDFIFKCVKINGSCFEYAPPMYHSDIEIVTEAIKQNPLHFYRINVTDNMKKECKISLLNSIERMPSKFADVLEYTKVMRKIDDLDVALKLIEKIPQSIHFLNEMIRKGCQDLAYKPTLLKNGYWMKNSEDAFQERIKHAYYSAKIDSNSDINYYRNHFNNQMNVWKASEWKKWD